LEFFFFASAEGKTGKCIYCKASLCIAAGSQGNLARHLNLKHPTVSVVLDHPETLASGAENNLSASESKLSS